MSDYADLPERFAKVRQTIAAACQRANRPIEDVTLVAVSKQHPAEAVLAAMACGQSHFGENRTEEAAAKIAAVHALSPDSAPVWHMIGHVQGRKARDVAPLFDVIHSVDSFKIAERCGRARAEAASERPLQVLVEVNISGEASKGGFLVNHWQDDPAQRQEFWQTMAKLVLIPYLDVIGLMTMAPIVANMEQTRPVFANLRALRDALRADIPKAILPHLSMGMTDDYPVAIEEGATMIRVGRALFGSQWEK
jgi:PLP dependent protein